MNNVGVFIYIYIETRALYRLLIQSELYSIEEYFTVP